MTKRLLWIVVSLIILIVSGVTIGCGKLSAIIPKNIPTVEDMRASLFAGYPYLEVYLNPKNATAGQLYLVDLYDKADGMFRERRNITFTQPQVNVGEVQKLVFNLSEQERGTYAWKTGDWWKSCFIIKINETIPEKSIRKPTLETSTNSKIPTPIQTTPHLQPILKLISPNGGDIWHLGETVTIKWVATNYSGYVEPSLSYDGGNKWYPLGSSNIGSLQYFVVSNISDEYRLSTHCRIKLQGVGNNIPIEPSISASDFTISE